MTARDKLLQRLADAQQVQEEATMGLIQLELDERTAGLDAAHDQAKAALEEAKAALVEPLAQLAMLEEKILVAERKCSDLRQQVDRLADDDDDDTAPDKLAAARMQLAEWEARVTRLRSKRDFCESGFQPLFEARKCAEEWVKVYRGLLHKVGKAFLDPFGELGQETTAYQSFRMLHLNHILLKNDRGDPEWPMALAELRELCLRSGYRTEGDLPTDAEQAARALEMSGMANAADTPPAPAPNMVDVMAQTNVEVTNMALQKSPSRIEDHRNTPPVPRGLPERDFMNVQRLRDLR